MQVQVTKWGSSLGVRIPLVLARKIGIHVGTPVEVSLQDHHLVIRKRYTLESMLNQMTEENIHEEILMGPTCGKEDW